MRLIRCYDLTLQTFNDESKLPDYAILSHRWVDGEEVLFKDLLKRRNEHLTGWQKIRRCCSHALLDGIEYCWVDTCCINKDSSAELSEAINSMYRWYSISKICYGYLSDVNITNRATWEQEFVSSTWFTRSWTLQELLAPREMEFYDCSWSKIGSRGSLCEEIAEASGIHLSVFTTPLDLSDWSVAQRMSWASNRAATRIEDIAYSLLGIFDVNMPLLYGEGTRAFLRLQEEIIRRTYDHTIFAWSTVVGDDGHRMENGLSYTGSLAISPGAFCRDGNLVVKGFIDPQPYTLTNLGLQISLPTELWAPNIYLGALNCTRNAHDPVGIFFLKSTVLTGISVRVGLSGKLCALRKSVKENTTETMTFATHLNESTISRLRTMPLTRCHSMIVNQTIYRKGTRWVQSSGHLKLLWAADASEFSSIEQGLRIPLHNKPLHDRPCRQLMVTHPYFGTCCVLNSEVKDGPIQAIKLGFDKDFRPVCIFADSSYTGEKWVTTRGSTTSLARTRCLSGTDLSQDSCLDSADWLQPSKDTQFHPKSMATGLWGLKGNSTLSSGFVLDIDSKTIKSLNINFDLEYSRRLQPFWIFKLGILLPT